MAECGAMLTESEFRAWRRRLGLSQIEVAALLGRSRRQIHGYEIGDKLPKVIQLAMAALERLPAKDLAEFGITPSWREKPRRRE
jgi:transcriptional regulator with XRE-family HTH domain